jgi:hypothetical protein
MRTWPLTRSSLAAALVVSLIVSDAVVGPSANAAEQEEPQPRPQCAWMTVPEENHASIRLQIDQPASDAQVAVDEQGRITIGGILHKHATMVDIWDRHVTSADFTLGPPPDGVSAWASSWTTSLRPPNLGENQVCARAEREPKRRATVQRSFTVVDLIPPSNVPNLAVSNITSTGALVTWGAASDNYGLAGYEVTIDGGSARRTGVGVRSFTISGLAPSTDHTVSVVAVDLAGNTSTTPATVSFRTLAQSQPPSGDFTFEPEQGAATASWEPDLPVEVTYRAFLDDQLLEEFPPSQYCQNANGDPASPCTSQDVISYPITALEQGTPYTLRVEALRTDGTVARTLSGLFTTTTGPDVVPVATTQLVVSEGTRCAGVGGDFYVAPDARTAVPIPAGSTQVFEGCYTVPNSSCIDGFLPPSGNRVLECRDDITGLLFALAPPGRGPVISALDGLGTPALAGPITTLSWCTLSGSCTLLLAPPTLAVRVAVAAPAALTLTGVLAAVGGGIVLGLALAALILILFPSELGIAGLLEYPIHFDDDFRTFDNWGANDGAFYDSLKIYTEVITTANQLTDRFNLPFAWDNAKDRDLKVTIDRACGAQQGRAPASGACDNGFAVYVPGGVNYRFRPMNQTGAHIVAAMGNGNPQPPSRAVWFFPARSEGGRAATSAGFNRRWFTRPPFIPNACTGRPSLFGCDEFPFWSTNQAVNLSGQVADLQPVPPGESSAQGTDLSQFYSQCHVDDDDGFMVLPLQAWVAANGPSFGFEVTEGGASMCLTPTLP